MTVDCGRDEWLLQARARLRKADPVLARLVDDRPAFDPRARLAQLPPMDLYGDLALRRLSRPPISSTTALPSRKYWRSPRSGGRTAALRPATSSRPRSSPSRSTLSRTSGGTHEHDRLHAPRPDSRCHAVLMGLRGLPGSGPPGLGASAGLPGMRSCRLL